MPGPLDHLLVVFILVAIPIDGVSERRRLKQALADGFPNAKSAAYVRIMAWQGGAVCVLLLYWVFASRQFTALGLRAPEGSGFLLAVVIAFAITALLVRQNRAAARRPELAAQVREAAASLEYLLPSTPEEFRRFTGLGVSAGIVEELIARGYLIWYFSSYSSDQMAVVLSALAFGIGHAYQGLSGILKTGSAGLVLGGLYLLSGSIWVPMFVHAAVDVLQGRLVYFATRTSPDAHPIAER